jgi:uncharacterized protein YceH (UPF0502 family)
MDDASWPALNFLERRILGVLVEKAKTTPDTYPLSLNSLMTGCNQKSNRDPVMDTDEGQLEEALEGLQAKGLVIRVQGGRVERWRHALYDEWKVGKPELAVLAELLLRGPQTEGELRGRAARMEPIDDLDQLRAVLKPLAERKLIVYLTPERSRGTMITHGFHAPEELAALRTRSGASSGTAEFASAAPSRLAAPVAPDRLAEAFAEIGKLRDEVEQLRGEVGRLAATVARLQQELGSSSS